MLIKSSSNIRNPIAYKKNVSFIPELAAHPREGTGHPKLLVAGNDITYSRRISKKDHKNVETRLIASLLSILLMKRNAEFGIIRSPQHINY